jgi:hypothetical protein
VLKSMGVTERAVVNQIANRAFLTQKANLRISSQKPEKYLPVVEASFPGALRQQLIPMSEELWKADSFDQFAARRRKILARAMNTFVDKLGTAGADASDHLGIGALIGSDEDHRIEFKSSLRHDYALGYTNKKLEGVVVKTVAGFLNAEGGDLVIGVDDDRTVLGLSPDYESSKSVGDRDGFERHLNNVLRGAKGDATLSFVTTTFHVVEGKEICQVSIEPSDHPVHVPGETGQIFFVRQGNATRSLDPKEAIAYVATRWKEY